METLSHNDILALNRAVGEIYCARDMESFYRSAFSSIQGIIPSELGSFNEVSLAPPRFLNGVHSSEDHHHVFKKLLPVFNEHCHEHPFTSYFESEDVIKTTDLATRGMFKGLALYNEYYRHLDVEVQIVMPFERVMGRRTLFTLSREGTDFSERDRLILTLLRPHLINALRNVTELGRMRLERDLLQKGAEAERQGVILLQSDGMILCISPVAKEMLKRWFDATTQEGHFLPGTLYQWFKAKGFSKIVEREPLTLEKEGRCLKIKLLNDFTTGDYIFVMTETDDSVILQNLQDYNLSCREIEVLKLLSIGKTNVEIAIILGLSKRTVEKHLERVFTKLGVETRTAAAAVVTQG